MEEMAKFFPPGVQWAIPYDSSRFVDISIRQVAETLLEAVALVFLVMLLFLQNLRYTLIPTIVVPVTLMGTFAVLLSLAPDTMPSSRAPDPASVHISTHCGLGTVTRQSLRTSR